VHFCLQPYTLFTLLLPFAYHLFPALAEYQPSVYSTLLFSPLLYKPTPQKVMKDWNSSTRSFRLCVAKVVVPVELWCLPLFHFAESRLSLWRQYLCSNYTLFVTFGYLWTLFVRMCGTIDPGSYIRWVLDFGIKTGYDRSGTRAVSAVGMPAYLEESLPCRILSICESILF
jgi:hypothetical protein